MGKKKVFNRNNMSFIDNALVNDATYFDYLDRFKKVALSMFEWVNLPKSMNARWLEMSLFYDGQASLLYDKNYGFINTRCNSNGYFNLYGLPSNLNCWSFEYHTTRNLYSGIKNYNFINKLLDKKVLPQKETDAIFVMNNWEAKPTATSMELFALRLFEAERTIDVNIKAQKTPVLIRVNENQRLTMENLYSQYDGNRPVIFGDKSQINDDILKSLNTGAPYVADKVQDYKKEIWNEALTFLGINNIMVDKKERLITDEANSNNELINLNLQAMLAPRQEACKQFNELFGLTGTENEISVRVRSDLHNIIKNAQSIVNDFDNLDLEEVIE